MARRIADAADAPVVKAVARAAGREAVWSWAADAIVGEALAAAAGVGVQTGEA